MGGLTGVCGCFKEFVKVFLSCFSCFADNVIAGILQEWKNEEKGFMIWSCSFWGQFDSFWAFCCAASFEVWWVPGKSCFLCWRVQLSPTIPMWFWEIKSHLIWKVQRNRAIFRVIRAEVKQLHFSVRQCTVWPLAHCFGERMHLQFCPVECKDEYRQVFVIVPETKTTLRLVDDKYETTRKRHLTSCPAQKPWILPCQLHHLSLQIAFMNTNRSQERKNLLQKVSKRKVQTRTLTKAPFIEYEIY